jgi:hypothetical protein
MTCSVIGSKTMSRCSSREALPRFTFSVLFVLLVENSAHGLFPVSARVYPRPKIVVSDILSFSRMLQDRLSELSGLALAAPLENL